MSKEENGSHFSNADRERIIKMDVKVERLITDVADLKNNYSDRIVKLENNKVDKTDAEKMIATAVADVALRAQVLEERTSLTNKIVYGCVGTILLGFIGAVLALVYKN